eukprot:scaffold2348_cov341-Prasinococcus_capsulatus_cf.AAC.6
MSLSENKMWTTVKPFMNGGLSGMGATCIIQPIDIVKVRLQLGATGGPLGVAAGIIRNEGFGTLYTVSGRRRTRWPPSAWRRGALSGMHSLGGACRVCQRACCVRRPTPQRAWASSSPSPTT